MTTQPAPEPGWKRGLKAASAVLVATGVAVGALVGIKTLNSGPPTIGGLVGCPVSGLASVDVAGLMKMHTGEAFYANFSTDWTGVGAAATKPSKGVDVIQDVSTATDPEPSECGAGSSAPSMYVSVKTVDAAGKDFPGWHFLGGGEWSLTGPWKLRAAPALQMGHLDVVLEPAEIKTS